MHQQSTSVCDLILPSFLITCTVESLTAGQTRDWISTVFYHLVRLESPNDPCGATVGIESRDCQDMRDSIVCVTVYVPGHIEVNRLVSRESSL